MKVKDYIEIIEKAAPLEGAYQWDNPGLVLGNPEADTDTVLVAMDLTSEVIEEAAETGAWLIITHHPVIFRPESSMREDRRVGRVLAAAARKNLAVYTAHTNLDVAEYGVNYQLVSGDYLRWRPFEIPV